MKTGESEITLHGLSKADELDIGGVDPEKKVTFLPIRKRGDRFGEPATIIAVLALSAINVIAAWIVKNRRRSIVELELEVRDANGSTRRVVCRKEVTSETSEAEVLKELAHLTQVAL